MSYVVGSKKPLNLLILMFIIRISSRFLLAIPGDAFGLKRLLQLRREVKAYLFQKITDRRKHIMELIAIGNTISSLKNDCYLDAYLHEAIMLDEKLGKHQHLFHGMSDLILSKKSKFLLNNYTFSIIKTI